MKHTLVAEWILVVCSAGLAAPAAAQVPPKPRPPVIDMHLHALPAKGWPGGPSFICPGMDFAAYDPRTKWDPNHLWESCPNPLFPPATDDELLREMLGTMDRYNVVLAATSGSLEYVRRYRQAAPKRILPALNTAVAHLGTPDSYASSFGRAKSRSWEKSRHRSREFLPTMKYWSLILRSQKNWTSRWRFTS